MRGRVGLPDRSALVRRLVRKQFFDVDNVARLERRRLARIEDDAFAVSDPSDADRAFDADLDYAAGVLKLDITDLTSCRQRNIELVEAIAYVPQLGRDLPLERRLGFLNPDVEIADVFLQP